MNLQGLSSGIRLVRVAVVVIALFSPYTAAYAQANDGATAKVGPVVLIDPSKSFDAMLTSFEKEIVSAAKAMPAEKYSFAPSPAAFASIQNTDFKGVRTFAQQITHITQANYFYASAVGSVKVDVDMKTISALTDKDKIVAALQASFIFAHKAMATLTKENAFERVHENDTRASLAGGLVAHGFDHYGQIAEYLRMNGIVPPASAK